MIITTHERDEVERTLLEKYPYRVIVSQNQETLFDGVFDSKSHAEDKVRELANVL